MRTTQVLPANASSLEVTWSLVALAGAGFATALLAHIWLSYSAVRAWIAEGRAYRWGPRHKFVLGFLIGVGLLLLVWLGFVALGVNALQNPPPLTPDREAASERGGWILVMLESTLLIFQIVLMWAWVAVGQPSLSPAAPKSPAALLFEAIDSGREMGHAIRNDAQLPLAVLEETAEREEVPDDLRDRAREAVASFERLLGQVDALHQSIKALEGTS